MSEQTPVEVVQPGYYSTPQQNGNTALRVILVIILVLVLCCCCAMIAFVAGLWGFLGWLWNNGDSIFYLGQLLPLVV